MKRNGNVNSDNLILVIMTEVILVTTTKSRNIKVTYLQ